MAYKYIYLVIMKSIPVIKPCWQIFVLFIFLFQPRKRQVMFSLFGDYRKKMQEDKRKEKLGDCYLSSLAITLQLTFMNLNFKPYRWAFFPHQKQNFRRTLIYCIKMNTIILYSQVSCWPSIWVVPRLAICWYWIHLYTLVEKGTLMCLATENNIHMY